MIFGIETVRGRYGEREAATRFGFPVWLRLGLLFDGWDSYHDAHIVFDQDSILYIGANGCPPSAELVKPGQREPDGYFPVMLPGLIEAHAHLFLDGGELDFKTRKHHLTRPPHEILPGAQLRLRRLLHFGIMGVRDAGDRHGIGLALAEGCRARNGDPAWASPYVDSPGAAIHRTGRYGSFIAEPIEACESLEEVVTSRVKVGARRIKLLVTGIINFKKGRVTSGPQMTAEEVKTIVGAARGYGRQTFAHATGTEGVENAILGGVDSIEHGFFLTREQLARMRDHNIAWVPTFAPIQAQIDEADRVGLDTQTVSWLDRILEEHGKQLVEAAKFGVRVLAGSDAGSWGVPHGEGFLRELERMEQAGLASRDVLRAATGASAERLSLGALGKIQTGQRPRFILMQLNPLESVRHLRGDKILFFDGDWITSDRFSGQCRL